MKLYYLTLFFNFLFYFQLGAKYRVLTPFRLELIVGSVLLFLILTKGIKENEKLNNDIFVRKLNNSIVAFFAIICGLMPFAFYKTRAVVFFIPFLKVFVTYWMLGYTITTKRRLIGFIWLYVILGSWVGLEALLNNNYDANGRLLGMRGLWHGANDLGGLLVSVLPFIYAILMSEKKIIKKITIGSLGALCLYMIIQTLSRTAFLGVIFFVLLLLLRSKKKLLGVAILVILTIAIWHFSDDSFKMRFKSIGASFDVEAMDGSQERRLLILKDGISLFVARPWGYGIQNFRSARGQTFNRWQESHCLYTQLLVDLGIQGFICFFFIITLILMLLNKALKNLKEDCFNKSYIYNLTYAVKDYLLIRLFVGVLAHNLWTNYWWFAAGLALAIHNIVFYKDKAIES